MSPDTHQMSYGMAWVIQDYRGQLLVSHAGMIDGFRVHITLVPHAGIGIVLLNNRHQTQMNLAVSNTLVDLLLGLPAKDWNAYFIGVLRKEGEAAETRHKEKVAQRPAGTKPSQPLSAYVGAYEEPAYGTARVTLEEDSLVWHWSTFHCRLVHLYRDTFELDEDGINRPEIIFTVVPEGGVAAMRLEEPIGVEFKRVGP